MPKPSKSDAIRPLPGGKIVGTLRPFLISLKEEQPAKSKIGGNRGEVVRRAMERSAAFRMQLESWIKSEMLTEQVQELGEPMAFPMLTVVCTDEAAKRIQSLPEVDAVLADDNSLGLVQ